MYHRMIKSKKRRLTAWVGLLTLLLILAGTYVLAAGELELQASPMELPPETLPVFLTREECYSAVLPAQTEYRRDVGSPWGKEQVLIEGADGEERCTARVEYCNGQEISRTVLTREVTIPARDWVIAVGTGEAEAAPSVKIGNGCILLPDGGILTYTHTTRVQATAFCPTDAGYRNSAIRPGIAAADPAIIPPGTRMFIQTTDGSFCYGIAQAADCGSGMQDPRVDLCFADHAECTAFGMQDCIVFFLG